MNNKPLLIALHGWRHSWPITRVSGCSLLFVATLLGLLFVAPEHDFAILRLSSDDIGVTRISMFLYYKPEDSLGYGSFGCSTILRWEVFAYRGQQECSGVDDGDTWFRVFANGV